MAQVRAAHRWFGGDSIYFDAAKSRYFGAVSLGFDGKGTRVRRKVSRDQA